MPECLPKHCFGILCRVAKWSFEKGNKAELGNTRFYYMKADPSRSKYSIKVNGHAVNLNDRDAMQFPCQLKNRREIRTTFKFSKIVRILGRC